MHKKLIIFLILYFALSLNGSGQVSAVMYYNGTVVVHFDSYKRIYVPENWTLEGSQNVTKVGNYIYPTSLPARASFKVESRGVLSIDEPNISYVTVILPLNSRISYMNPTPSSLTENNNELNIDFNSSNVTIAFYLVSGSSLFNNPYFYSTIASSSVTAYFGYLLWSSRSGTQLVEPNELDERDLRIIEAIKNGADSLNKISEVSLLPRTTVYRRVKRLIGLGIIEEVRERGKVKYLLKGGSK
ncbi:MAG: ArsR family transcriptional regulator [Metallosphaera sp.]